MKINEEIIFNAVKRLGEICIDGLHIIDNTDFRGDEESFRVYHKDGYCFDIEKYPNYDVETEKFINWEYSFYSEYEGFNKCSIKKAFELINNIK